ncbi:MAG: sugar phosphate isomerase/epimerase [Kiritimatiellae bacterium]|nr:sugar phosphate isomerase/epimerase [Kiritimatiellia bacterium]
MKLSLSTNWCNRRMESGEEIADAAAALGFDELELGFHTSVQQVAGFRNRLDSIPVGSVHAFCPVPISAPHGHPELYSLASFDPEARALARFHIAKNIDFAADIGADTVVLHAGRVWFTSFFRRNFTSAVLCESLEKAKGNVADKKHAKLLARAMKLRRSRGAELLELFKAELAPLVPLLEKRGVVLALENLPYLEGFPDESEMAALAAEFSSSPVKAWFDTGHHRVREMHGWLSDGFSSTVPNEEFWSFIRGMHLNDVVDFNDDHLPPGEGKVDFAALARLASGVKHVVVEPNASVRTEALAKGVAHIKSIWK